MQHPIDQLDSLLTETIHPNQFTTQPQLETQISNFIATVKTAQAEIRQFLWRKVSKGKNLGTIERLVSLYQASITRLLDSLFQYQSNIPRNTPVYKCYQSIYQELESLLSYIERCFPHYIHTPKKEQECGQLQPSLPSAQPFIQTNLGGAHIYTLVLLSIDSGLVLNHQYGSLAELVAPIMATRHKKGLSPDSLKKYKDKITPAVKDEVRQKLRKMIELLEHI